MADKSKVKINKLSAPPLSGVLPKYTRVPLSDIPVKNHGPRRTSSSRFQEKSRNKIVKLPAFHEVDPSQRQTLFKEKVKQCCIVFDFTNPISDAEGKELKREILKELVDFIADPEENKKSFANEIYSEVFNMIQVNLFRPLAPRLNPSGPAYDPEEDEPILEEAWPHLRIIYKFFLHFLESPAFDTQAAQLALSKPWLEQLLALFDSEDPRERDYLKTTLHRIYGRFLEYRQFIRAQICNIFYTFVYETERHNGIAELLEILGTIIHGFALPLKPEHISFLQRALLPLHKVQYAGLYYPQLAYCVFQFLEKDPSLTHLIFSSLLHFWPVVNSPKEMMFLSEIEELLSIVVPEQLVRILVPLFKKLARCMASPHFQVAEKALCFWRKKLFMKITRRHLPTLLPIVYGPLYTNSKNHWHRAVRVMSLNALRLFMEMDGKLFTQCTEQYRREFQRDKKAKEESDRKWEELEHLIQAQQQEEQEEQKKHDEVLRVVAKELNVPSAKPIRRKSMLPIDSQTLEALQNHVGLDDTGGENRDDDEEEEEYDDESTESSGDEEDEESISASSETDDDDDDDACHPAVRS